VSERRRHIRTRKRLRVLYGENDLTKVGFTRDVSAGGMFIICHGPLPAGNRLHVQVYLDEKDFLLLEGVQIHKKTVPAALRGSTEQGFGVRFLSPMEALARVTSSATEPLPGGPSGGHGDGQGHGQGHASEDPTFSAEYRDQNALSAAWHRELRHGGLFVSTVQPLDRDQPVSIQLRLPFAAVKLEVSGRVLQTVSGAAPGLSLAFAEPRRILPLLESFLR
jgi:Tfp pilus assembly protein PilZ